MKKIIQTIFILALTIQVIHAQNDDTKKADKHFDRLEYIDAIEDYEKLVEKGKADAYVYRQLAIASYNVFNTKKAISYYKEYLEMDESAKAEDHFRYAQLLMSQKEYIKAKEAFLDFAQKAPNDSRAIAFMANPDFMMDLQDMEPKYDAKPLELNSEYSDFAGYESDTYLYFTSSRNKNRRNYGWNEQPTTDIYRAENVAGTFKNEKLVEGDVNSKYNEGTIAITNDGQTMYFSRNNFLNGDYEKSESGRSKLKIYRASLVNGEWQEIEELPFNSDEYEVSHPALSPDNSTLYFSSDMEGGYGASDLYMVSINDDGSFGEPQNLGANINTEGRENFPFIDADGKLFFSSDGHLGLGGLDVFYADMQGGQYGTTTNLGIPVNSTMDDFAFSYFNQVDRGYVSSNRGDNVLDDNIYGIQLLRPLDETNIIVSVLNADTNEPLSAAQIIIYDDKDIQVSSMSTDESGEAQQIVISKIEYDVQVNLDDYESSSKTVTALGDTMMVEVKLKPVEVLIVEREVTLPNVFFEFDKATIRPEAAFELDKIAETLLKYPDINIKIESYTDRRGPESYNKTLSEARAQSTLEYLVSKGVDESRLSAEGLGETNPINDCANGCTEDEHEENRRSKFIIVE
jgi:outer membrane protein OmpA-like peptidoglycan-associated protein/tetratricopeptide (TPR) repeat protein